MRSKLPKYNEQGLRRCGRCNHYFPATNQHFKKNSSESDGLYSYCKPCTKVVKATYYDIHKETIKQKNRVLYESNREKYIKQSKEYYHKNKAKTAERYKVWASNNQETLRKNRRLWEARNPEKVFLNMNLKRARRKKAEGVYSMEDIHALFLSQEGLCFYCKRGIKDKYHIDHYIPLSKGGSNWPSNLRLSCPNCNHRKSDKLPEVFIGEIQNESKG